MWLFDEVDCLLIDSDFSLLVDVVLDFGWSCCVGDNGRLCGIIPGKTKLKVDVSLNVNDDERNNCGMLIVVFVFCIRFESFDDCWTKRGRPYFSLWRKLLKYVSKSFNV